MGMMLIDPYYLMFLLPALLLAGWASWRTKSTFAKYDRNPGSPAPRRPNGYCVITA